MKYERLYLEEVDDVMDLVVRADAYRTEYNTIRPHEAVARPGLDMAGSCPWLA